LTGGEPLSRRARKVLSRFRRYESMREQRSEIRMLCADMIEVQWKDQGGRILRGAGLLEDISASGACLQVESAIPLGVEIRWECAGTRFEGEVRYCVYLEIGYFVGVEFHSNSRWSSNHYQPQHLLDLRELADRAKR
jgi:PilZ domain